MVTLKDRTTGEEYPLEDDNIHKYWNEQTAYKGSVFVIEPHFEVEKYDKFAMLVKDNTEEPVWICFNRATIEKESTREHITGLFKDNPFYRIHISDHDSRQT